MFRRKTLSTVVIVALASGMPMSASGSEGMVDRGVQAAVGAVGSLREWASTGVQSTEAAAAWKSFNRRDRSAIDRLEELAQKGNADAQNYLGHIIAEGLDRRKKETPITDAAAWFAAAAQSGHPAAIYNLALLQYKGVGLQFDEDRAMRAMNSAKARVPKAAVHLALYHYRRSEYALAWENANFAAGQGEGMGMYIAGKMIHEGTAQGGTSVRLIRSYLKEASKHYIADAAWIVAVTYDDDGSDPDSIMLSRAYRLISVGMDRSGSKQTPQILSGLSTREARRAQSFAQNWFKRFKRPEPKSYMTTIPEPPAIRPMKTF